MAQKEMIYLQLLEFGFHNNLYAIMEECLKHLEENKSDIV